MRRNWRFESIAMPGRQHPVQITAVGDDPRLVQRRPQLHAAIELAEHRRGVVGEPMRDVGIQPTATIVERRRQVPVIKRRHRLDTVFQ